jgi:hypothetical protein
MNAIVSPQPAASPPSTRSEVGVLHTESPPAPAIVPAPTVAADVRIADVPASLPVEEAGVVQSAARPSDLETLIAVARAAAGLTSDDEKAGLLTDVLARGVRDGELQAETLRSAATVGSSHHRRRVLLALLGTALVAGTESQFLSAAEGITGTHDRATVLTAFARADGLTNRDIRAEFLRAAASVTSTHERTQLLALVIRLPGFDAAGALEILPAIRAISSSHEKANLLAALAGRGVAENAAVREAFIAAASSVSSDSEYLRVMRAAGLSAASRRR